MHLGPTELIIIFGIALLLFGAGRVSRLGGELGSAIREFRRGLGGGEEKKNSEELPNTTTKQN